MRSIPHAPRPVCTTERWVGTRVHNSQLRPVHSPVGGQALTRVKVHGKACRGVTGLFVLYLPSSVHVCVHVCVCMCILYMVFWPRFLVTCGASVGQGEEVLPGA